MKDRIIYTDENGIVVTVTPTDEYVAEHGLQAVIDKDIPKDRQHWVVKDTDVPYHANFVAEAWEIKNGKITVNMDKAKTLCINYVRKMMNTKIAEYTIDGVDIKAKFAEIKDKIDKCSDVKKLEQLIMNI